MPYTFAPISKVAESIAEFEFEVTFFSIELVRL